MSIEVEWEGTIWDRCRKKPRRVKTFAAAFSIGFGKTVATVTVDGTPSEAPTTADRKKRVWSNPHEDCK